jgi:hypothetical protein
MQDFEFEKFITDIVQREEEASRRLEEYGQGQEEHPQRRYNRLYRELPQNRISYRGGR